MRPPLPGVFEPHFSHASLARLPTWRLARVHLYTPTTTDVSSKYPKTLVGGLWGIVLAWTLAHWRNMNYWLLAFAFGLVVPTLVGWFVVPVIKGTPIMGGPPWIIQVVRPLPNAVWAIGTAWLLTYLPANFIWHR